MLKIKSLKQRTQAQNLKMPSIKNLHFPNMRIHHKLEEVKVLKKDNKQVDKKQQISVQYTTKLQRTYSMNLLGLKKDSQLAYSPRKKRANPDRENMNEIKVQKFELPCGYGQNQQQGYHYSRQTMLTNQKFHSKKNSLYDLRQQIKKQLSNDKLMMQSMFPGVKLQNLDYTEKRMKFFDNFHPETDTLGFDEIQAIRTSRKKQLFNGKILAVKRQKQELPDELITRKLIWEGRETKKVDHNLICKDLLEKAKIQKLQRPLEQEDEQKSIDEQICLTAWGDHEEIKMIKRVSSTKGIKSKLMKVDC